MSACLILQTPETIFIGTDTAVSTTVDDQIYRLSDDGEKLWQIDDMTIFCSGDMNLSRKVMRTFAKLPDRSIESLNMTVAYICGISSNNDICLIVGKVDKNGSFVYEISAENRFELIERRMDLGRTDIALWSAGIKTQESVELAESYLFKGYDVLTTYKEVFNAISYEGIGGLLLLKQVRHSQVKELLYEPIREKPDMRILTEEIYNKLLQPQLIFGERIFGKLLAGVNLQIDASDVNGNKTFTVDENGVTISGMALKITGGLPANQLDPSFKNGLVSQATAYNGVVIDSIRGLVVSDSNNLVRTVMNATEGLRFQKNISGNWVDQLYYDTTSGNLVMNGTIDAKEFKINGVTALVGNKISVNSIEPLEVGRNVVMGKNTSISWADQVTGKPFIPTSATQIGGISSTYIDANGIWTGLINANSIIAGTISGNYISGGVISGTTINVNTDLTVGDNIIMGSRDTVGSRSLVFGGRGSITFNNAGMEVGANTRINLQCSSVAVNSFEVATQDWVKTNTIAKFG